MIEYFSNKKVTVEEYKQVLIKSGIRRPTSDLKRLELMLNNSNFVLTAWDNDKLVGILRGMTDFSYACYLSDLAIDKEYQKQGIGKNLISMCRKILGEKVAIILLSAPSVMGYYLKMRLLYLGGNRNNLVFNIQLYKVC